MWAATTDEFEGGWAAGMRVQRMPTPSAHAPCIASLPDECYVWDVLDAAAVDRHIWTRDKGQWRALRRFGIYQKDKWRPIDDATEAGFRGVTGSNEKISLIRPDSPARIAAAFHAAQMRWQDRLDRKGTWNARHGTAVRGVSDRYQHGKEDVRKAFRRLCARNAWVVCVYNPITRRAGFLIIPSFIFGALSAVYGWIRLASLYSNSARRLLAVATTDYFDDFQFGGPSYDQPSAQTSTRRVRPTHGPRLRRKEEVVWQRGS